jgi:nicotinate-nucleotide pyrophosphorylase (carboxylating)
VRQAREWIRKHMPEPDRSRMIVEIEVDTLAQLDEVLPAGPDIVLLDNMTLGDLRAAVARRDAVNPEVQLEASGGVNLGTIRAIAESGVDRISVGAITHSAGSLDIGLDWSASGP